MAAATASGLEIEAKTGEEQQPEEARWAPFLDLPCRLTVDLPLPSFKVSRFLSLRVGSILATRWGLARDLPLRINGTLIGWGELEANSSRLAVRVTELV